MGSKCIFFVRILVKFDVSMDCGIFIYLLTLKTLSLVCVYACAFAHSYVFMCISVPVHHLKIADKFCRKKYFDSPTHTQFQSWNIGNILSKNLERQTISKKMITCSYSSSFKEKKALKIKGY